MFVIPAIWRLGKKTAPNSKASLGYTENSRQTSKSSGGGIMWVYTMQGGQNRRHREDSKPLVSTVKKTLFTGSAKEAEVG